MSTDHTTPPVLPKFRNLALGRGGGARTFGAEDRMGPQSPIACLLEEVGAEDPTGPETPNAVA